jgi:pimeloyl-ACP methyl ester carboxylesterase
MSLGYGRPVSTPPFVDLPDGVVAERWPVRGSARAVLHAGLDGAREWAILVPGFTGSKEDFIALLPLLAEQGVGVVAFDQLGQYESDASDDPHDYALSRLAGDVAELAAVAARRCGLATAPHLVGHSFGGLVAQEAVAGDRLRPASLVLLCSGPGALPEDRWQDLPALVEALDVHDLATLWRIMAEMAEGDPGAGGPVPSADVHAFLERRWHANSPVQLSVVARLLMSQPPLTDRVRAAVGAQLPVTVMWGAHDDAWPIEVQQVMAGALGAATVEVPGVGHSPNAEDPAGTVAALLAAWRPGR